MVFSSESETNPHMTIAVLMFLGSVESFIVVLQIVSPDHVQF